MSRRCFCRSTCCRTCRNRHRIRRCRRRRFRCYHPRRFRRYHRRFRLRHHRFCHRFCHRICLMSRRSCRCTCHFGWRVLAGCKQQQPPGWRERQQPPGGRERWQQPPGGREQAIPPIFGGTPVFDSLILKGQGGMEINSLSPPVILNFLCSAAELKAAAAKGLVTCWTPAPNP
jgi:hypothetical protein